MNIVLIYISGAGGGGERAEEGRHKSDSNARSSSSGSPRSLRSRTRSSASTEMPRTEPGAGTAAVRAGTPIEPEYMGLHASPSRLRSSSGEGPTGFGSGGTGSPPSLPDTGATSSASRSLKRRRRHPSSPSSEAEEEGADVSPTPGPALERMNGSGDSHEDNGGSRHRKRCGLIETDTSDDVDPVEAVAKMMVDHLVDFKGCRRHDHSRERSVGDVGPLGLKDFIRQRDRIWSSSPSFIPPDFADATLLPSEARLEYEDSESELEDGWETGNAGDVPLFRTSPSDWKECHTNVGLLLTGGADSDDDGDDDGTRLNRYLDVGRGDKLSTLSTRRMAQGIVTFDLDSALAVFADLSVIRALISISVDANPMKNLKRSVHVYHGGVPLHLIPHFHLGQFGHDPQFDLFIILPALYQSDAKRTRDNPYNHVPEIVRRKFMDDCLLPAIKSVITVNESQDWDFNYATSKAKAMAVHQERSMYRDERTGFKQQIRYELGAEHIPAVWARCAAAIRRIMADDVEDDTMKAFEVRCSLSSDMLTFIIGISILRQCQGLQESNGQNAILGSVDRL